MNYLWTIRHVSGIKESYTNSGFFTHLEVAPHFAGWARLAAQATISTHSYSTTTESSGWQSATSICWIRLNHSMTVVFFDYWSFAPEEVEVALRIDMDKRVLSKISI